MDKKDYMRMKIALFIAITIFISITNAHAYMSYGSTGCGTLISAVDTTSEKDKYSKDLNEVIVKSWIAGYITACNSWMETVTNKSNFDVISTTDVEGVYMSVVKYCRAHPLENITVAIVSTLNELEAKGKRN